MSYFKLRMLHFLLYTIILYGARLPDMICPATTLFILTITIEPILLELTVDNEFHYFTEKGRYSYEAVLRQV